MKNTLFKKTLTIAATLLLISIFGMLALGSSSGSTATTDQGTGSAAQVSPSDNAATTDQGTDSASQGNSSFTDCTIDIKSCRLAKSYDGKAVAIITYGYTNNSDSATSFCVAVKTNVFQNGIGLNNAYILDKSANYSADNQTKELKKGSTLDVEVAYELNDSTTDIVVEVEEFLSFKDFKVTKTFKIA